MPPSRILLKPKVGRETTKQLLVALRLNFVEKCVRIQISRMHGPLRLPELLATVNTLHSAWIVLGQL